MCPDDSKLQRDRALEGKEAEDEEGMELECWRK
jgi:hypothetical protein